ncbi:hypothetical protein ABIA32_003223 [Streptacidiphilus sp. MAP12-20]
MSQKGCARWTRTAPPCLVSHGSRKQPLPTRGPNPSIRRVLPPWRGPHQPAGSAGHVPPHPPHSPGRRPDASPCGIPTPPGPRSSGHADPGGRSAVCSEGRWPCSSRQSLRSIAGSHRGTTSLPGQPWGELNAGGRGLGQPHQRRPGARESTEQGQHPSSSRSTPRHARITPLRSREAVPARVPPEALSSMRPTPRPDRTAICSRGDARGALRALSEQSAAENSRLPARTGTSAPAGSPRRPTTDSKQDEASA